MPFKSDALMDTMYSPDCLVSPGTLHEAPLQQQQREAEDGDYEGEAAPGVLPARGQEGQQHDTWVSGSVPSLGHGAILSYLERRRP